MKALSKLIIFCMTISSVSWADGYQLQTIHFVDGTTVKLSTEVQSITPSNDGKIDTVELKDGRILYGEDIASGKASSLKDNKIVILSPKKINSMIQERSFGGDGSGGG